MANFTLKSEPVRINTIIGTLFSDMVKPASNYTVPFGHIGGAVVYVLKQVRLGIQKVVTVAVRVSLGAIKFVYENNQWYRRRETVRGNVWVDTENGEADRWVKTKDGDTERWQ